MSKIPVHERINQRIDNTVQTRDVNTESHQFVLRRGEVERVKDAGNHKGSPAQEERKDND